MHPATPDPVTTAARPAPQRGARAVKVLLLLLLVGAVGTPAGQAVEFLAQTMAREHAVDAAARRAVLRRERKVAAGSFVLACLVSPVDPVVRTVQDALLPPVRAPDGARDA